MIEKCNLCGICLAKDPLFSAMKRETVSPRGKIELLKKGMIDKIFYIDSLSGDLKKHCPNKIDLTEEIRTARAKLVEQGIETSANKKMIENLKKFGTLYGDPQNPDKDLFWC